MFFRVNDSLAQLADALRERLQIISDEKSRRDANAHMQRLQEISDRIEMLEQQLPREIDPQLRHFLHRRSYSKALEYLTASKLSS